MVQNSVPLVSRLAWASPASPGPHRTGERGGCRGALPERTLPEGRSWTIVKWGNSLEEENVDVISLVILEDGLGFQSIVANFCFDSSPHSFLHSPKC